MGGVQWLSAPCRPFPGAHSGVFTDGGQRFYALLLPMLWVHEVTWDLACTRYELRISATRDMNLGQIGFFGFVGVS